MPDDSFDRLMRRTLSRDVSDGACPDPAVLAAFAVARLSADERRAVEAHSAGCSRCAAALALLATTAEVAPDGVAVQEPAFRPSWRWAVPLVTAVLVFAIWIEIESPERQASRGPADAPTATQSADSSPARRTDRTTQKPAPPAPESYREVEPGAPPAALAPRSRGAAAPAQPEDTVARDAADSATKKVTPPNAGARAESAPSAPASPPSTPGGRSEGYALESQSAEKPSSEPSSDAEVRALAREENVATAAELRAAPFELRGPGAVRIRATATGIERSTDGGATWHNERRGSAGTIVAGACPSEDVCWLGADEGRVLRREAGGRWVETRLPTPERIVAIEAENAERATVKTGSGRRFATEDGGRTWSSLP